MFPLSVLLMHRCCRPAVCNFNLHLQARHGPVHPSYPMGGNADYTKAGYFSSSHRQVSPGGSHQKAARYVHRLTTSPRVPRLHVPASWGVTSGVLGRRRRWERHHLWIHKIVLPKVKTTQHQAATIRSLSRLQDRRRPPLAVPTIHSHSRSNRAVAANPQVAQQRFHRRRLSSSLRPHHQPPHHRRRQHLHPRPSPAVALARRDQLLRMGASARWF